MAAAGTWGTTAAATYRSIPRTIPRGTKDGKLPLDFRTGARGTSDSVAGRENELLEATIAMATFVFVNGHGPLP